jgi:hypothetical protein
LTTAAEASKTRESAATAAKTTSENVAKLAEYVIHIHTGSTATTKTTVKCLVSKTIVFSTLIVIAKNFICFRSLLKGFLCIGIARVFIGVKLYRFLSVSLFISAFVALLLNPNIS